MTAHISSAQAASGQGAEPPLCTPKDVLAGDSNGAG